MSEDKNITPFELEKLSNYEFIVGRCLYCGSTVLQELEAWKRYRCLECERELKINEIVVGAQIIQELYRKS